MIHRPSNQEVFEILRRHGKLPPMAGGTLQSAGPLFHPAPFQYSFAPAFASILLDAVNEKAGAIFQPGKAGTVVGIEFLTGTVTTGGTVDVRLETVSVVSGNPSGTLFAANSNYSLVIADTDDNAWLGAAQSLTGSAVVALTDIVAAVIVVPAGANLNIQRSGVPARADFPYTSQFVASWSHSMLCPVVALRYSDGSYAYCPGVWPTSSLTGTTFNSGSTPDERGIYFQVPFKCRVAGWWFHGSKSGDMNVVLYDSDGSTALQTASLDQDVDATNADNYYAGYFSGQTTLNINTWYRLAVKPTTVTSVKLWELGVSVAANMDGLEGGQKIYLSTRTDAGAWTQTATSRPFMGIIIDQLDDGVGGGGGETFTGTLINRGIH